MEAWAQVRRNGGSAGVDGETVKSVESYGVDRWLGELARDLKDGTCKPKPVRQVLIPKKQPGKFRPLGIPCIRDRVAQTSAMLVLTPIFECQRRSKSTPLAGVKMHHLMRFSPALAVVPVVHRRDPRCFV